MLWQDLLWELQQTLKILIGGGSRISGKAVSTEGDEYVLRKFSLCLSSPTLSSVPKEPYKSLQFLTSASYIIAWKHLPYIIPFGPIITLKSKQRGYYLSPFSRYRQPHRGTVTCSRSGLVSCMLGTWSQGPSLYLPLSLSYVTLTLDSTILNVHWHGCKHLIPKASFKGKLLPKKVELLQFRWDPYLSLTQLCLDLEKWWGQILKDSPSLPLPPDCFSALDMELPNTGHTAEMIQDMFHAKTHSPLPYTALITHSKSTITKGQPWTMQWSRHWACNGGKRTWSLPL